jgi:hypothetical protein
MTPRATDDVIELRVDEIAQLFHTSKAIVEARPYEANQPDTGAAENLAQRRTSAEEPIPNSRCSA